MYVPPLVLLLVLLVLLAAMGRSDAPCRSEFVDDEPQPVRAKPKPFSAMSPREKAAVVGGRVVLVAGVAAVAVAIVWLTAQIFGSSAATSVAVLIGLIICDSLLFKEW